jgi:hypothetical protein
VFIASAMASLVKPSPSHNDFRLKEFREAYAGFARKERYRRLAIKSS